MITSHADCVFWVAARGDRDSFANGLREAGAAVQVFGIGEKVQVGPLIYNVLEAEWSPQIGRGEQARLPARRFLTVHLSVTNSGAEPVAVPSFRIVDEAGHQYSESMDGQNVASWLGLIRSLKPVETLDGNILFDVEPEIL